ncbi:hypothetical protein Tco_0833441 [Tanacetum coccineum]
MPLRLTLLSFYIVRTTSGFDHNHKSHLHRDLENLSNSTRGDSPGHQDFTQTNQIAEKWILAESKRQLLTLGKPHTALQTDMSEGFQREEDFEWTSMMSRRMRDVALIRSKRLKECTGAANRNQAPSCESRKDKTLCNTGDIHRVEL